jgi:hypothetical protein
VATAARFSVRRPRGASHLWRRHPLTQKPPERVSTGTRRWLLSGALGGAAGRTLWPWRVVYATVQPSGQRTVGVHVTFAMTCWLPQTDAALAQVERRESWDTPSGFAQFIAVWGSRRYQGKIFGKEDNDAITVGRQSRLHPKNKMLRGICLHRMREMSSHWTVKPVASQRFRDRYKHLLKHQLRLTVNLPALTPGTPNCLLPAVGQRREAMII